MHQDGMAEDQETYPQAIPPHDPGAFCHGGPAITGDEIGPYWDKGMAICPRRFHTSIWLPLLCLKFGKVLNSSCRSTLCFFSGLSRHQPGEGFGLFCSTQHR